MRPSVLGVQASCAVGVSPALPQAPLAHAASRASTCELDLWLDWEAVKAVPRRRVLGVQRLVQHAPSSTPRGDGRRDRGATP